MSATVTAPVRSLNELGTLASALDSLCEVAGDYAEGLDRERRNIAQGLLDAARCVAQVMAADLDTLAEAERQARIAADTLPEGGAA